MIKKFAKSNHSSRPGVLTFDDFCWMVEDGEKADLINGAIYMASPDNLFANALCLWLSSLIALYISKNQLGRVFISRVAFRLDDLNCPEPDIAFLDKKHKNRLRKGHVLGAPNLAMEIVSPDSVERDYVTKQKLYEAAGVREYWIIDEFKKLVTLLRLDSRGKYREVRPQKGLLYSQVIKGFWLDPSWLWQEPLPDTLETLHLIQLH